MSVPDTFLRGHLQASFVLLLFAAVPGIEARGGETLEPREHGDARDGLDAAKRLERLKSLTDEDLKQTYLEIPQEEAVRDDEKRLVFESCLLEMAHRGGVKWERFLKDQLREAERLPKGDELERIKKLFGSKPLEILTALRHAQKKPDPIAIEVKGPKLVKTEFPKLPVFKVALKNVDVGKRSVVIQQGGNYRGGRPGRWRFDVRTSEGKPVPIKQQWGAIGGLTSREPLRSGETWTATLDMSSFIEIDTPGDYTVTVQYHDSAYLSNVKDPAGLIVCRSKPIRLAVESRRIELTKSEENKARRLLSALDGDAPLKIVAGPYGFRNADFIDPSSPPGKLLRTGWKAVPVLIDALEDSELDPRKRAWILGMLFTITGRHSPLGSHGVLPSHTWEGGSWSHWGKKSGEGGSGGFGFGGRGSSGGRVDLEKQKAFAAYWLKWKATLSSPARQTEVLSPNSVPGGQPRRPPPTASPTAAATATEAGVVVPVDRDRSRSLTSPTPLRPGRSSPCARNPRNDYELDVTTSHSAAQENLHPKVAFGRNQRGTQISQTRRRLRRRQERVSDGQLGRRFLLPTKICAICVICGFLFSCVELLRKTRRSFDGRV